MKKYIIGIGIIVAGLTACKDKEAAVDNSNLQQQKQQIEQQIDSLHNILAQINKELETTEEKEIPAIKGQQIQPQSFTHYIELQGNVDTDGNVMVIPEAMGKIVKIYKKEGDKVRKGETILRLDDSMLRSQISEINTQYDLAKTAYERQKRLWEQKIGSEMAYLQAKTKKESLAKKLHTIRTQMSKMHVKAPISGTLDDLMAKEGEMAAPQKPVARVVNLSRVYMQADVSEKYLSKIKKGTETLIDFPELNKQIASNISYVGNFIHPNNRTFKIRINILNLDHSLKPNLTGNIKIKDFETNNAIVLPQSLIQEDRTGNNFVYVLHSSTDQKEIFEIKKKAIKTGVSYKGNIVIETGLQSGDILAIEGARGLTEGDMVTLKNTELINNTEPETKDEITDKNTKTHIVQKGETLYRIHKKYNVSLAKLKAWNKLKGNAVKVGQKLIVEKQN